MTALSDTETTLGQWADDFRAKADEIVQAHLPAVHDAADALATFQASPIVQELGQFAAGELPAGTEAAIVAILRDAREGAAKVADLTASLDAATAPPPAPEQPGDGEQSPEQQ